ncbi:VIT family protein [Nocardioides sp. Kera G14]|uniref:VIT1/CCC1 transporter family protein n=1 Tax=Nocardioides sp. Kera G14 TaxID=2884264 RepID=UPI001D10A4CE|nr:VIT family protein [Nocardioides sp. Kera G14]UDY23281.1 VIT family protein [Nocardioides sp. Kera G14]
MAELIDLHEHAHGDVGEGLSNRLNWLRAGVLGANDGIVSVAGIVMGVAGATSNRSDIVIAGVAALVAGALSMAAGEYVSVSTQRDAELALIDAEKHDLAHMPEEELHHLTHMLEERGLTPETAAKAAVELTEWNDLRVHAKLEFNIDVDDVTNPWGAALASAVSFTIGALLPVLMILLPAGVRIWATLAAVAVALAITGWVSAKVGYAKPGRALVRNVAGGVLAMLVTWGIGHLLGTTVV